VPSLLLDRPCPDFDELVRVLKGEQSPRRAHIVELGIDGFHSFQDLILPAAEVKARYGGRVALLGGVDMDKLASLPEDELRRYLRSILDGCMPAGRFAFGSGNTIANYIPLKNYAILLEDGAPLEAVNRPAPAPRKSR
jgi:hypothetical protein